MRGLAAVSGLLSAARTSSGSGSRSYPTTDRGAAGEKRSTSVAAELEPLALDGDPLDAIDGALVG
ncbi:Hypothetical protein AJAP_01830 [Amycolatopsis japonica]|uniref:Uncharacterized protein n=1 Tax=Amycolatopsis japonica TaxID=208439 RepID=A0A075ULL2_9PSEU|nr:Hypothetical protein AJAP_01830 [Amycolatopsis japonica]